MPRSISELLHPDSTNEEKSKPENFPLGNRRYTQSHYGKLPPPSDEANLKISHWAIDVMEEVLLHTFKTVWRGAKLYIQSHYRKAPPPSDNQLLHYKDLAIFFFEKDMRPGATMKFQFPRNSNTATFLPRESAQSIPFSSNKLPEIFNHFSVKPTSEEAKTIKQTIEECEAPGLKGEEKYCATSLESMVDFSTSKLGTRNVEAISTEVLEEGATKYMHNYTTMPGLKKLEGDKVVVCHKENYPYAVFFCHAIKQTAAYVSSLKADDGMKVKAVNHLSSRHIRMGPRALSFQILNVKPEPLPSAISF
ncbi:BURP domain-containing protein, partial [Prunus dulcis]